MENNSRTSLINPQQLAEPNALTEKEREQVLVEWNQTAREYPSEQCIHQLFEAQVVQTPDAVAIVFEDEQLSYRELNERANQLAHYLQSVGVGPEVLVGVCMQRSVEMIVALLAILKAGGAYVPLDPSYPQQRLSFMLDDADVKVLLIQEHLRDTLSANGATVLCLDSGGLKVLAAQSRENAPSRVNAQNLAYVIYTSGSTGRPKGVMVGHGGVCNLARAQGRAFNVEGGSRVLQFASFSFDASVSEVFKTLSVGATLCLATSEQMMAGPDLNQLLKDKAITTVTLPPSVLATLPRAELPALHTIVVAGDACPADAATRWTKGRHFINAYGPTEATVCATIGEYVDQGSRLSIGRPIDNAQVYLLDEYQQPVAIGVPGEIHIGGAGLARGYLKRAEITAEKFIPHPFSDVPGARLYRTGDLARYLPDGNIDFLGRIDNQVKVRGFRIELEEVESVLVEHSSVRAAAVLAHEDAQGDKRLVAYVVKDQRQTSSSDGLRDHLKQRLPEYMLPSELIVLESLPLTSNGKLDRQALPAPSPLRVDLEGDYQAPRTKLEQLLATLWQEVLGVEKVGVLNNFFDLGGNSIKAAILLNRLQETLGEVIYVVALFDAPTIGQLAKFLEEHYADAVSGICGGPSRRDNQARSEKIDAFKLAQLREMIQPLPFRQERKAPTGAKNPRAIFILSPPRSGSTLLRVMLAGHKGLFAPPELQLLPFDTLRERKEAFSGRYSFWLEGTIRAIMEIKDCDGPAATKLMEDREAQQLSTREFYRQMQDWIGARILVDKTPSYCLSLETLKKAEESFDDALYINLIRHPQGMIRSFVDAKLDQIFRYEHSFSTRELAELIWVACYQNILEFLESVPEHRQHRVRFEELVKEPRSVITDLCGFMGLELEEDMLEPHRDKEKRMTTGIHGLSRMLGDIKFHTHQGIDARTAERWKEKSDQGALGDITWQVAESLGYENTSKSEQGGEQSTSTAIPNAWTQIPSQPRKNKTANQV